MARICLLTTGQPSTNPRLVKEADALSEAGHEVRTIAAHWARWADEMDQRLLASRHWSCTFVGGHPVEHPVSYNWSRIRHRAGRALSTSRVSPERLQAWSISRVLPELERAALRSRADLYIGHNLGALPPAVHAAQHWGALAGYDAEDLLTSESGSGGLASAGETVLEKVERRYMPRCDYLTAASSGIAEVYAAKYDIDTPVTVLNVFPLSQRPEVFRPSDEEVPVRLYWFSQTIGHSRGLEDIVRAIGNLLGEPIELHLRGWWQPGYEDTLRALFRDCGLRPAQLVWHPPASPDDMVRLAAEYEVGLALELPDTASRDLCLTNKIFTYLLAGNAVIATSTRGQRPIIERIGEAGFVYEAGDAMALTRQLEVWLADRAQLERARWVAWEWGTRRYNWDCEKPTFLRTVESVLTRRGLPAA